ncbi:LOB domain-containing protein 27-like [Prosopis cineraria]|uniref:LOB domain-containing protein 27-like n=1 Tax=Prosopis cineraria TaxID=364024 RepID=UPI0024100B0F|nr:LOB domain-containing protein 27-like [Prosopis cineraria]
MTIKGGSNKACAACKYQRRRCTKECPLAPYFPADQPKKFSNAHRLFGVANIKKILDQVEPRKRDEAMTSIIFESDMREKFPVLGCLGLTWNYNNQILAAMEELRYLKLRLAIHKQQLHCHVSHQISPSHPVTESMPFSTDTLSVSNYLQYNINLNNNQVVTFDGGGGSEVFGLQQSFSSMAVPSSDFIANQPEMGTVEYEDINPYNVMVDDRQLFIEYREEPCESSKESSLTEAKCHHIERGSELKSAAAYMGFTSVKG